MRARILIVDDERLIRWTLREALAPDGFEVVESESLATARAAAKSADFDVALVDFRLPDGDGLTLMAELREMMPGLPVIIVTAYSSIEAAVPAIKAGASDYIAKPFEVEALRFSVRRALEESHMRRRLSAELSDRRAQFSIASIVGESPTLLAIKQLVRRVAASPSSTVLLLGESGVGKDLVARALHFESSRAARPYVNITCTAIPEGLLESELFGHEAGSFTNAGTRKKGLFELAESGTVFLDEIGDMSPALQGKLLRVLEEKAFKRVGGTADVRVDVRIVAATNGDLEALVDSGKFRRDLYYRLNVVPILLPPLRERTEDIAPLAQHFISVFAREFRRSPLALTASASAALNAHPWPGNVRELRNVIERAVLLAPGPEITLEDLLLAPARMSVSDAAPAPPLTSLFEAERLLVQRALAQSAGNLTRAGELLGISRDQVRLKIRKHQLGRAGVESQEP